MRCGLRRFANDKTNTRSWLDDKFTNIHNTIVEHGSGLAMLYNLQKQCLAPVNLSSLPRNSLRSIAVSWFTNQLMPIMYFQTKTAINCGRLHKCLVCGVLCVVVCVLWCVLWVLWCVLWCVVVCVVLWCGVQAPLGPPKSVK